MSGRALHHVALGAHDVDKLATFYSEVFGLPEIARHPDASGGLRSIWLDAGGVILMVERTTESAPRVDGVDKGPFLLAFRIDTEEKPALEAELAQRGIPIESRTEFSSYARDPEGNRVAICHYAHTT